MSESKGWGSCCFCGFLIREIVLQAETADMESITVSITTRDEMGSQLILWLNKVVNHCCIAGVECVVSQGAKVFT